MIVAWSFPPNFSPILTKELFVSFRQRYIATCRGTIIDLIRRCDFMSAILIEKWVATSFNNHIDRNFLLLFLNDVTHYLFCKFHGNRNVVKGGKGTDADKRTLEDTNVIFYVGGQIESHILGQMDVLISAFLLRMATLVSRSGG